MIDHDKIWNKMEDDILKKNGPTPLKKMFEFEVDEKAWKKAISEGTIIKLNY